MKTKNVNHVTIVFLAALLFPIFSNAQWWTTGNSLSSGNYLGSTNAQDVLLKTEQSQAIRFFTTAGSGTFNNERVTIAAGGNVGIGVTNPATPLHVFASSATQTADYASALIVNEATSSTASIVKVGLDIQSTGNWLGTSARNIGLNVYVDGGTNNYSGIFSGGNVGIGAATPTELLQVLGGNIDVNSLDKAYMINRAPFLWCNNEPTNIFAGIAAGTAGQHNSFVGYSAGNSNTADDNTFVGFAAGSGNSSGSNNTFVGSEAGWDNTTASFNTMVGNLAGYDNNADGNTFVGYSSGTNSVSGDENTYVGYMAGVTNGSGQLNAGLGSYAGADNTSGQYNVFAGYMSGDNNTSGSNNVFVGHNARPSTGALTNVTAIGSNSYVTQSNSLILGSISTNPGSPANTSVGIGTSAPSARLHVHGTLRFSNNGEQNGFVLTSDANGVATWQPAATGTVSTCTTSVQNYLPKWCSTSNQLENSIVFDDNTNVGIATTTPAAKLHVRNITGGEGIRVLTNFSPSIVNRGITAGATGAAINMGAWTQGGQIGFGVTVGIVTSPTSAVNALPCNVGTVGVADGNTFNFGGIFEANGCAGNNYGIYAMGLKDCADPTAGGIAGYFQGDALASGAFTSISDKMFKDSVTEVSNALGLISRLQPKEFVFRNDSFPYMNLPVGHHYGVIAQELDTVLPDLVSNFVQPRIIDTLGTILQDSLTFKAVNYIDLIPIAIRGIQELDSLKVGTNATAADSNHVVKWNTTDKTLVNSQIYDNGTHIGIPAVDANSYVNVVNHDRDIAVNVESDYDETTEVIKATYNTDTNPNEVVAVYGYSKYVNGSSADDGIGGKFIGGKAGVHGIADGDNSIQIGVGGESMNSTSMNVGVLAKAVRFTPGVNVGFSAYVDSADAMNVGVAAESNYINSGSTNAGIICAAQGSSTQNVGGVFQALDSVGSRTGIYAEAHSLAMGPVAYAGYFDGDVHATGTVTWTSDAQLKQNINELRPETALAAILQLQPKTYEYRTADFPHLGLSHGPQYGLLAQEVEQVLPALVKAERHPVIRNIKGEVTSPAYDYKGLNYVGLIPVLIGAVKEQQQKIDSLEEVITDKLTQLEERINGCCGRGDANKRDENEAPASAAHQLSVELSSMQVIVLEQNVPNPFAEQTSISYFIPEGTGVAQLIFTDMLGRTIKTMELQNGYGIVTVFASNLSKGQYSYTLVIDGKTIETKRMTKSR